MNNVEYIDKKYCNSMRKIFPDWEGELDIPRSNYEAKQIGKHEVRRIPFRGGITTVALTSLDIKGVFMMETNLQEPFNRLILRIKGGKKVDSEYFVMKAPNVSSIDELCTDSKLKWEVFVPEIMPNIVPSDISRLWTNKFSFREENNVDGSIGLRPPQIGALHAIAAHFAVDENHEPALVVLPTGTGKTETMLSYIVYKRISKTMIIVPSDALRNQIGDKLEELGILPDIGVIPFDTTCPFVMKLKSGVDSIDEAKELVANTNILITLPQTLMKSSPDVIKFFSEQFSSLFVDEAHHVPATQWTKIHQMFSEKMIVQFTATPFRRDNKRIDGDIIFNYKLGTAQKDGYYKSIILKAIEEYGDVGSHDYAIAKKAVEVLRNDRSATGGEYDHVLMARCEKKERAIAVHKIYQELAPEMNPQLVYSGSGRIVKNREALDKIKYRSSSSSNIVVCVDMLGEGFDLPNLKIAALHDTHKSLAITLQFIGRFTRKGNWSKVGDATVIANIADVEMEKRLEALYAEGADWDVLIKRLSEDRINQEMQFQEVIHSLQEHGDLNERISLWNLRPSLSTQIFKTQCVDWNPLEYKNTLGKDVLSWHSYSEKHNTLIYVTYKDVPVRWGKYQNLCDQQYDLAIARWDKANNVLFIYSNDYDAVKSIKLSKIITDDNTTLINGPQIFNILNNVELPLVKNLGSSRVGAISFTSYFGPNVTEGLALIEKAQSNLSNIACVGYEDGDRVLWGGASKKGKIWQQASGTIAEWIDWTEGAWEKIADENENDVINITKDFLRPVQLFEGYVEYPIGIQWGEQAQGGISDKQYIVFGNKEIPLFLIEVEITNVFEDKSIEFTVSAEDYEAIFTFAIDKSINEGYKYTRKTEIEVFFKRGNGNKMAIEEYLVKDPFIIRYADGTYSYNCYHIPINVNAGEYPREWIDTYSWEGIPLNKESAGKLIDKKTIQYQSYVNIYNEYDLIFNDDGKGEAGDLVGLKSIDDETIKLTLIHCKNAHKGKVSNDIRNFYTVCGQAQKSIRVKHMGMKKLYHDLKRRNEQWTKEGYSRFLKGDIRLLSYFKDRTRKADVQFEVIIVQPGGSKKSVSTDILKLLGTTEQYIKTTTQGELKVIMSE